MLAVFGACFCVVRIVAIMVLRIDNLRGTGVGEFRERISLLSSAYLRRFF